MLRIYSIFYIYVLICKFPTGIKASHPGFVFATAESVAQIKNISIDQVLNTIRTNVKHIYGF